MDHVQDSAQPDGSVIVESTSVTTLKGSANFIRGMFSDQGEPSSSRVLTCILALVTAGILIGVVRHVCALKDPQTLTLWLGALPIFVTSMTVFFLSPYTVKVGSASLSDVIGSFRKPQ
jgi:hypothetical protein